jgi:single-strand DNA-binding protein
MGYHSTTVVGHLGRDAELRFTKGGEPVSGFSVAVSEKFTGRDGQKRETTTWYNCDLWGKSAEALQEYLVKGKLVLVVGRMQERKYTGKDGTEKKAWSLKVDRVTLLGGKGDRGERRQSEDDAPSDSPAPSESPAPSDDSEIPF